MWRDVFGSVVELLKLKSTVDLHGEQLKEVHGELRRISNALERLEIRLDPLEKSERQERDKLVLQLENALLASTVGFPKRRVFLRASVKAG
jgi:hypothetical protein